MRGKGITSGRRPVRPDGSHYRESRRRRLSGGGGGGGRRLRVGITWVALAAGVIAVVLFVTWILR